MSLLAELEAIKARYFGREATALPELADLYLTLLNHVLSRQRENDWTSGHDFQTVLVAHSVRQLTELGIGLDEMWNLAGDRDRTEGNLLRGVRLLTAQWHEPRRGRWSRWADDVWDDCYVALSLKTVLPQLGEMSQELAAKVDEQLGETLGWIRDEALDGFSRAADTQWRGPGLAAAAIEVASAFSSDAASPDIAQAAVDYLVKTLPRMAGERWAVIAPWHIGQVVTTWCRHRDTWPELAAIQSLVQVSYDILMKSQQDGAWFGLNGPDSAEGVYCTARALAAAYSMEPGQSSPAIERAHDYLRQQALGEPPLHGTKACLNVLEALQIRLNYSAKGRISPVNLHLLLELSARLQRNGLHQVLEGNHNSDDVLLGSVQIAARRELERRGRSVIQPLGVNDALLELLNTRKVFIQEFGVDGADTRATLRRFFSATIDEVRSESARHLLKALWSRSGFLTFLPFLESVSDLEHKRAFYSRYRDHVNHELMVFVTGCYFYYKCDKIRDAIDREIAIHNQNAGTPAQESEKEFLFRWKLISTFHDVGYMFEVDPNTSEASHLDKAKLLEESLETINEFGETFPHAYLQRQLQMDETNAKALVSMLERQLGRPPRTALTKVDDLLVHDDDPWERMASYTGPRIPAELFKNYFQMCRSEDGPRSRFYDHGIMSALVFLETTALQHRTLRHWQEGALRKKLGAPEFTRLRDLLSTESARDHLEPSRFWVRFNHVAGAIALHNIFPKLYGSEVAVKYHLHDAFYGTAPASRYTIGLQEIPLAFLTAVTDTLQEWDRHTFRRPLFVRSDQQPLAAGEVYLGSSDDGRLLIRPLSERSKERYRKQFSIMPNWITGLEDVIRLEA